MAKGTKGLPQPQANGAPKGATPNWSKQIGKGGKSTMKKGAKC